jgi:hypothetical protein
MTVPIVLRLAMREWELSESLSNFRVLHKTLLVKFLVG